MSQADAFLDAIREAPDDDVPRLVFADWLDEHGDADRAAFVRAQVEAARLPAHDPDRLDREDEADDLLGRHPEWAGSLPEVAGAWEFRRGFVESVTLQAGPFLSYARGLMAAFPLRHLCLGEAGPQLAFLARCAELARLGSLALRRRDLLDRLDAEQLGELFASPHLGRLTALGLSGCGVEWPAMRALLGSPLLAHLTRLDLGGNVSIADRAVRQLAQAPAARSLEVLVLAGTGITTAGLLDLLKAPCLTNLTSLDLTGCNSAGRLPDSAAAVKAVTAGLPPRLTALHLNNVLLAEAALALVRSPAAGQLTDLRLAGAVAGDGLAVVLARAPRAAALRALDLSSNKLGPAAARALAEAPALAGLAELRLSRNQLRDTGARALAASPHLRGLTALDLSQNEIGGPGLQALLGSPVLAGVTALDLSGNYIGAATVEALARSPHLGRLTRLDLTGASLDADSARALADSPNLARLRTLNLALTRLGDEGVQALADSPHLARLRELNLAVNGVGKAGAEALAASPHLRRLRTLVLRNSNLTEAERDLLTARFGDGVVF